MSTTASLRALARGEQAYRKHLKARRDQRGGEVDSDPSKNKGWTFSKLEYLSRTQIISDNQETPGTGDMSEARWVGRDQDRRQQEARRREILGNM